MQNITSRFFLFLFLMSGAGLGSSVTVRAASAGIVAGNPVTLSVAVNGTAPFTYQWYKDGAVLTGSTNSTYVISSFLAANVGTYSTVIANSAGSTTSDNAVLTLSAAPVAFTTQPSSQTVTSGATVTFTAAASGTPTPTYQWQKGGVAISGATSASYSIVGVTSGSAGSYAVVATNSAGSVTSSSAVLTVNVAPAFTTQPTSHTVTVGGSVTFTAAASGTPTPTYQWQKGGVNISGATGTSYSIASTVTGDAGSYAVLAANSVGSVTSNTATLTVNAAAGIPVISTQPASVTVTGGVSATFTVIASGTPTPTYQWKKGGVNISGATNATYTISITGPSDASTYTVAVTNSAGSVTSGGAVLTVNSAPVFIAQPVSQAVSFGGGATFTAAASGSPAPTYQWQLGGVNIAGATNSTCAIAIATTGNAGSYTVIATNAIGSATSSAAVLAVVVMPSNGIITIAVSP